MVSVTCAMAIAVQPFNKVGDGIGLAVFVAQFVNMVQVWRGVIATSPDKRELMPLAGSIFTTISAGVAAAQAIAFRPVLSWHRGCKTTLWKLLMYKWENCTYAAGFLQQLCYSTHGEWLGAIRSGNAQAQQGAFSYGWLQRNAGQQRLRGMAYGVCFKRCAQGCNTCCRAYSLGIGWHATFEHICSIQYRRCHFHRPRTGRNLLV